MLFILNMWFLKVFKIAFGKSKTYIYQNTFIFSVLTLIWIKVNSYKSRELFVILELKNH